MTTSSPAPPAETPRTWNVLVRWPGEAWLPLWHTNRSEAEARAEFIGRAMEPFLARVADYRLVEGCAMTWTDTSVPKALLTEMGTVHNEHERLLS